MPLILSMATSILKYPYFLSGDGPECYYCGHDNEEDCNAEHHGLAVRCQTQDPESHHYGDACYVGHSSNCKPIFVPIEMNIPIIN